MGKVGVGWIWNHDVASLAFEQTDSPHAATPSDYFVALLFEVPGSQVDISTLVLPQSDIIRIFSIAAPTEIEAGQSYIIRQWMQKEIPLKSAGTVTVEIQHNVLHIFLLVKTSYCS